MWSLRWGDVTWKGSFRCWNNFLDPKGCEPWIVCRSRRAKDGSSVSLPPAATAELLERLSIADQEFTDESVGEIRLDRWFAWQQRIENVGHAETLGRRVRPPMREALPLQFRFTGEEERIAVQLELPVGTYEALAEYWLAEKVAAE